MSGAFLRRRDWIARALPVEHFSAAGNTQRIGIMKTDDVSETVREIREETIEAIVEDAISEGAYPEQWDVDSLHSRTLAVFGLDLSVREWAAATSRRLRPRPIRRS